MLNINRPIRVAFIHEWFEVHAGSEAGLAEMAKNFPGADIYALVDFNTRGPDHWLSKHRVTTSWIQKLPFSRYYFRALLPFFPHAIQSFDLSSYDLVISNSHCAAKDVLTGPDQIHVCMCYSPVRYAYDLRDVYFDNRPTRSPIKAMIRWLRESLLLRLRIVDMVTANTVDHFIAISQFIRKRIAKYYRRESDVIYCPVDVSRFWYDGPREEKDYYISVCRLVRYKNVQKFAAAFATDPARKLKIVGSGEMLNEIKRIAANAPNVEVLGHLPTEQIVHLLRGAKAYLFGSIEDFGIAPLEAQAAGTPVIAYARGGALETIRGLDSEKPTGVFFDELSQDGIMRAVETFESSRAVITPENCRENSLRFSTERFQREFRIVIERVAPHCAIWKSE